MQLSNNYSAVGFSGKVPVKNWKTKDGKKFVDGLKDVVSNLEPPKADKFLKRDAGVSGYRCYQSNSNGNKLGEMVNGVLDVNHENIAKKLTGWLPKNLS